VIAEKVALALEANPLVSMKAVNKILMIQVRRLSHFLPSRWVRMLDKGYDLLTKFNVVEMRLEDLNHLPPIRVPDGFVVCILEPGREKDYIAVMRQSLKKNADPEWFRQSFFSDVEYDPQNLILVYREKTPVAAAAAWQYKLKNRTIGHLRSVGVIQDFRGKGLGRQVSLIALHRLKDRGFHEVMLKTQGNRLRAIQLYLLLGFKPRYSLLAGKRKWRRLLSKIRCC